jgi:hypothetical protein
MYKILSVIVWSLVGLAAGLVSVMVLDIENFNVAMIAISVFGLSCLSLSILAAMK